MVEFLKSKYFLWLVLSVPMFGLLASMASYPWSEEAFEELMHESGEVGARLLVFTLLISPLRLFFSKNRFLIWALKNRRYLGVAAFVYVLLHLCAYFLHNKYGAILEDLTVPRYVFGWIAFLILLSLAVTSANWAVRKLGGAKWKNLHRLVYLAAFCVAAHWFLKEGGAPGPTLVHFAPLLVLECWRIYKSKFTPRKVDNI